MTGLFQSMGLALLGIIAVPLLTLASLAVARRPIVAMVAGIGFSVFSLTHFGSSIFRYVILISLIPHFVSALNNSRLNLKTKFPSLVLPVIYVTVCYVSALWSLEPIQTLVSASAWVILLLFIYTFRATLRWEIIRNAVFYILLAFFLFSMAFLLLPLGWEAGRARGIFINANTAGIFTFLLMGMSLWMGKKYWIWVIPTGFAFTLASGSRASLLAVVILLAIAFAAQVRWGTRITLAGFGIAIGFPLIQWAWARIQEIEVDNTSILRTNNSRENVWDQAFKFIQNNPLLGAGYRATPEGIGSSSYIKLFAEFGLFLASFGIILAAAYLWWSRHDPIMLGITCATLVNTFFEDWLLTAGAPMLLVYLMVLFSTPQVVARRKKAGEAVRTAKQALPSENRCAIA